MAVSGRQSAIGELAGPGQHVAFQGKPAVERPALRALLRTYLDTLGFPNMRLKLFIRCYLSARIVVGGFVNLTGKARNLGLPGTTTISRICSTDAFERLSNSSRCWTQTPKPVTHSFQLVFPDQG